MFQTYKRLILPLYIPSLLSASVRTATIILLPLYLLELNYSVGTVSFVIAVRGLGILLMDIPAGLMANRYGDKPIMVLGSATLLVAVMMFGLTDSMPLILVASALMGASGALSMVGRLSYLTDSCVSHERGRVIAMMAGLQRVASLLGPVIFSYAAKHLEYQPAFLIMAVVIACNLLLVVVFAKHIEAAHRKQAPISGLFRMLVQHRQILITTGFAGLALMMLRTGRQLLFPLFGHGIGLDVVHVGLLVSLSSAIDSLMFYPAGQIMDRKGRKWTSIPGMLILSLSLAILPLCPNLTGMLVFAVVSGLGNGITSGVLLTIGSDVAPEA
jgi:MFS family permease